MRRPRHQGGCRSTVGRVLRPGFREPASHPHRGPAGAGDRPHPAREPPGRTSRRTGLGVLRPPPGKTVLPPSAGARRDVSQTGSSRPDLDDPPQPPATGGGPAMDLRPAHRCRAGRITGPPRRLLRRTVRAGTVPHTHARRHLPLEPRGRRRPGPRRPRHPRPGRFRRPHRRPGEGLDRVLGAGRRGGGGRPSDLPSPPMGRVPAPPGVRLRGHHRHSRQGTHQSGLRRTLLLGHRDLPGTVPPTGATRRGPSPAGVPLPHARRRPGPGQRALPAWGPVPVADHLRGGGVRLLRGGHCPIPHRCRGGLRAPRLRGGHRRRIHPR